MEARADRESRPRDKNGVLMPMLLGHLKPLTEAELAVLAGGPVRKRDFDDASRWKVAKDKYYFVSASDKKSWPWPSCLWARLKLEPQP